jgi:hypothetical protein
MSGFDSKSVMCDWTTGVHRYREPVPAWESGKIVKIDRDGVIEWEKRQWHTIKCPSSDTSIRFSCDGERLRFMGNIGRFREKDNATGIGVIQSIDKWSEYFADVLGLPMDMFGSIHAKGTAFESGTTLSRVDLCSNYDVDDYPSFVTVAMTKRLGRRLPSMGKYGPLWGDGATRSNWWKAKIYDKSAELAGERGPRKGATTARFEVQLGGEYLKREGLNYVQNWDNKGVNMAEIIYGRFASELFKENASVEDWSDMPPRLLGYALMWRDGMNIRNLFAHEASFCRVKRQLREHGIDLDIPCNITALTRRVREVHVNQLNVLREAA